jgi:hypothetical protein
MSNRTLYQRVLGKDFDRLPPILQRFHSRPQGGKASGFVTVRRGGGWLQHAMSQALRLPPPGEDIPVTLEVVPQGERELWVRRFGGECLRTLQWQEGEFLVEKTGPLLFVFCLCADEEGITFRFQHNRLEAFPRPHFTALGVDAAVQSEDDQGWRILVHITLPHLGRLTTYEGEVTPDIC